MARTNVGAEPVPDENEVMMYNYGGSISTVYNPKVVAQQGIQNYESYQLTGEPRARQAFVSADNWLLCTLCRQGQLFALGVRL